MGFKFQGFDFLHLDASFSEDELLVRRTARDFVEDNLIPIIEECFREERFPRELVPVMGELSDIPKNILRAFSKRRADIEAAMDERGVTSASSAEKAALATRARKPDGTAPFDLLREGWKPQLAEIPYPDDEGGHPPAPTAAGCRAPRRRPGGGWSGTGTA